MEMKVVVRRVLERTELRAVGRPEKQQRRGVTLAPKQGVRVVRTR
jgi:cytochrome P450